MLPMRAALLLGIVAATALIAGSIGYHLGRHHYRNNSSAENYYYYYNLSNKLPGQQHQNKQVATTTTDGVDGWKTIDVFVGNATHYVEEFDLNDDDDDDNHQQQQAALGGGDDMEQQQFTTTSLRDRQLLLQRKLRWYSQAKQDEIVAGLLNNKTNGYFVDLAANDATTLSNTYALERYYNWTGTCVEPNPIYWYNLTTLRPNCRVAAAVVGDATQRLERVYFRYEAGDHGGIAASDGRGFDNGRRWQKSSKIAFTVPLVEVLRRYNAPTTDIDYLSLDVEGAESFIMLNFPFDTYRFKVITAERLKGEIRTYLKSHGYEFVKRLSTWGESLWIRTSIKHELDMSHLDNYQFPIV